MKFFSFSVSDILLVSDLKVYGLANYLKIKKEELNFGRNYHCDKTFLKNNNQIEINHENISSYFD